VYFVTNRCLQTRFFLRPSAKVNAIVRACLAWAADKHQVTIYGFVFMSNHFHMLVSAPLLNLSEFLGEFQGRLARDLNALHGRTSYFWDDRFRCEHVLDDKAMIDKLGYILTNPVESLLVRHPEQWPGVSSWEAHMSDAKVSGRFILMKEYRAMLREDPDLTLEEARIRYTFELAKLPCWEDLSDAEYRDKVREHVDGRCNEICTYADDIGASFMGAKAVMRQDWRRMADSPKRSPQPLCHCYDAELIEAHRKWLYEVWDSYKKAMGAFHSRSRKTMPQFPPGTYPPGRLRCVGA
jgi:REP element-mobilizing transposase RayT